MTFKNIFAYFTGFFIIFIYLYFRLFYHRPDKTLEFFCKYESQIYINGNIMLFVLIFFMVSTYYIIYFYKGRLNPNSRITNNIMIKCFRYVIDYIKDSLRLINKLIADYVPNSYENLRDFILWFYKKYGYKEKLLIFIFNSPYIIVPICFLFDTAMFKLKFFYMALPILIFPVLWNIFLFLIEEILKNLEAIAEDVIIEHEFLPDGKDRFTFSIKPESTQDTIHFLKDIGIPEFLRLYPLKGFLDNLYLLESYYKPRFLLFMYSIYFICCFYIISKNIILFLYTI